MTTIADGMTPQQRIDTPIDQVPGNAVLVQRLEAGSAQPTGLSLQTPRVTPTVEIAGNADHLYWRDNEQFTLNVTNTSEPTATDRSIIVQVDIAGEPARFLVDAAGQPLARSHQQQLAPGERFALEIRTKEFLPDIHTLLQDTLYGARIYVTAWESTASPTPGSLLLGEAFYVYRFVDAVDSIHDDHTISMIAALNDGTGAGTVQRVRPLDIVAGTDAEPTVTVDDSTHFQFVGGASPQFVFDPTATGNLSTHVHIKRRDSWS